MEDNRRPSYTELDTIPPQKMDKLIREGKLDRQYCMGYLDHRTRQIMSGLTNKDKEDGKEYKYPSKDFGILAYFFVLDQGLEYKDALEMAKQCLGESDEWLKEVRNKHFRHSREVTRSYDDHPLQKEMRKEKRMSRTPLTNARSVAQLTKELEFQVTLYKDIKQLQKGMSELKDRVEGLERRRDITDSRVESLYSITEAPNSPQEEAKVLRERGWKVKDIAEHLGVARKTVSRWTR